MTPPPVPSRTAGMRRGPRVGALLLALSLGVVGCTHVPQSSGVRTSPPLEDTADAVDAPQFRPPGPAADADAEALIRGFMTAGTGPQEDYAVAREYLSGPATQKWAPDRRTVVYAAEPTITQAQGEGAYQIQVEVESVVDEFGMRTMAPAGTTQAWNVTVEERDGALRITAVDDGTLLSRAQFAQLFAPQELYFYDQSLTYAVPDVRWFVNRRSTVTAVARALLRGPAPYVTGAVTTAFPLRTGADLNGPSVPITADGVAGVDLTAATVEGADPERLSRMQEQLELTLEGLYTVEQVEVTVEGRPLGAASGERTLAPARVDPSPGSVQVGVEQSSDELALFQGLSVTPVGGVPPVAGLRPQGPSMTLDRTAFAFLDGDRRALYVARTDGTLHRAVQGAALTAPSVDAQGWAWTVDRSARSRISAVPTREGQPRVVTASWLKEGESIVELRMGPSGVRAAVVVDDGQHRTLRVAGVVRGSDGVPSALTEPILVPTMTSPDRVEWNGHLSLVATELAVGPEDPVRPEIVSLDGNRRELNPLAGLRNISAGETGTLFAETADSVYLLVGSSWRSQELTEPVRDISYPW